MTRVEPTSGEARSGILLLTIGAAGALAAHFAGIPAGMVIGALIASGIYRLSGGKIGEWRHKYGTVGRLLLGAFIGASFTPEAVKPLMQAIGPMCLLISTMLATGLVLGWTVSRIAGVSLATGLLSSMPGGLPAMAAMAEDLDADATVVAVIHLARLLTILLIIPVLLPLLAQQPTAGAALDIPATHVSISRTALALAGAWLGGWIATRAGIPTGDLIGGMVAVAVANLAGANLGPLHPVLRQLAQLLIGIAVGAQVTVESLKKLHRLALPAAAIIVSLVGFGLASGWVLHKATPLDLPTALLSAVPGGASTMPVIAQDLGGDATLVAALHLVRQIAIFILLPPVLGMLLRRSLRDEFSGSESKPSKAPPS
ncbi:MAG: AbrB family transcriptional regulator [Anaerolineae bacterium]|nr:AbrB family transcriptional regulator [Anaerolineae bacterium]